ncbi:MAG: DUF427 domain-containing protein [Gammaproteobacteria bacterium]|nr:DUF427 domain-containing protein [Gammaproteobacteria bacterium]
MAEVTDAVLAARAKWRFRGAGRPSFAPAPGPGQESVWDYPRPPRVAPDARRVRVMHGARVLADSIRALRVLETASPPAFYLPPDDVEDALLRPSGRTTFCEWKGLAREFDATDRDGVAWTYVDTFPEFTRIAGYFSFYPGRVHCTVEGETVRPQAGDYYGGWVTGEVLGPMKGAPGSAWW